MTGAQSRRIAALRKKYPGLEWSTTNGVRVRYMDGNERVEGIVHESGLVEEVSRDVKDPDRR